jgi:hypothetical protein
MESGLAAFVAGDYTKAFELLVFDSSGGFILPNSECTRCIFCFI